MMIQKGRWMSTKAPASTARGEESDKGGDGEANGLEEDEGEQGVEKTSRR